ncbi:MAG: hypothetical protein AB7N65_28015 [Vicinamibacterales bacterium]
MRRPLTDVRSAIRALRLRPAFAVTVILTLSLGIGAATTVWSFAYALLVRPYPYAAPHELVRVQSVYTKEGGVAGGRQFLRGQNEHGSGPDAGHHPPDDPEH